MHGEAAGSNKEAADKFVDEFADYVKCDDFVLQKVFNSDETRLFWEKKKYEERPTSFRRRHSLDTSQ